MADLSSCLVGEWVHSHEDDQGDQQVYRPASYPFPPARGRVGYTFEADGRLVYRGIATADGSTAVDGRWSLGSGDTLDLTFDGPGDHALQVVSCGDGQLVLRPQG